MPVRVSRPQRSFDSSTGLFAVFHALHRLLAPRHPPHALSSLAALILPSLAPLPPVVHGRPRTPFGPGPNQFRIASSYRAIRTFPHDGRVFSNDPFSLGSCRDSQETPRLQHRTGRPVP